MVKKELIAGELVIVYQVVPKLAFPGGDWV